mmetsp:Transcript_7263/g.21508  ORF Transcript_7263/g.21508 Transcript_7263/m.21508 type:complete len:205 (-) Transcript_7263:79-693(-)
MKSSREAFFASSTDHTQLLKTAEVHRLEENGKRKYVLVAQGMDSSLVKRVPQLHLARIFLDGNTLYGAKVVNKTLGDPADVCGRLFDAAVNDFAAGQSTRAQSTLHGLSKWVSSGGTSIDALSILDENQKEAVIAIANGENDQRVYSNGRKGWELLATEFVSKELGLEARLYQSKGGTLSGIEHHSDMDYYSESGGATAIFSFS